MTASTFAPGGEERAHRPGVFRLAVAASVVTLALVTCFGAAAIHAWNMHGRTIECEDGGVPVRGGWAEPDGCRYPSGAVLLAPGRGEAHLLDPWTSAVTAAGVIAATALLAVRAVARVRGTSLRRSIGFSVATSVVLVGASAALYRSLLVG